MPNWNSILDEINTTPSPHDSNRRKYLREYAELTDRNVIIYYSGWLQKSQMGNYPGFIVNDDDKNGFMTAIHGLDKSKGLDLFLHTPGGEISATESLVDYLRGVFNNNIRAIIPQLAMSAGTMIALSCKEIIMGKHSSLGPIDPQIFGLPAHGILEEFNQAADEIQKNPTRIPVWQPIISKYNPTLIGECQKAIQWSNEVVKQWLKTGMFLDDPDRDAKVDRIIKELGDHSLTKSHARHISAKTAIDKGLKVLLFEDDQQLQEKALSIHHSCILTLSGSGAYKIIENQNGVAFIQSIRQTPLIQ
jgi:ATP-dependent protease ClpP protease subunit